MSGRSEFAPRRVRLVTAAKELLTEGGVEAPTTERVAKLAGVATGTIYNHFIDIDDLLAVAIADLLDGESPELGVILAEEATIMRPRVSRHLIREQDLRTRGVHQATTFDPDAHRR